MFGLFGLGASGMVVKRNAPAIMPVINRISTNVLTGSSVWAGKIIQKIRLGFLK